MSYQDEDWGIERLSESELLVDVKDTQSYHSFERRNQSCHAGREVDRVRSIKTFITDEIKELQTDYQLLSTAEAFLSYYQEALSGSESAPPDKPWFPLMMMLLELLKGVESLEEADTLEVFIRSFLFSAKSLGYEFPEGE